MKSLLRKILIGLSRVYFGRNLVTKDILSVEGGGLRKYKIYNVTENTSTP